MGSRLGPNYACLFMGHIEEQIFDQYTRTVPALYKRYIDDIVGAISSSKSEIEFEDFATYVNGFHPSLKFTLSISDEQLPFLDLYLKPTSDRLITSIYYKETDTHSYLNYSPTCIKRSPLIGEWPTDRLIQIDRLIQVQLACKDASEIRI